MEQKPQSAVPHDSDISSLASPEPRGLWLLSHTRVGERGPFPSTQKFRQTPREGAGFS